jgi:hypothetical protein
LFTSGAWTGAAIVNSGVLDLVNCSLEQNSSPESAGAISNSGALDAVNCRFNSNSSQGHAAVLYNFDGVAQFTNCTIADNSTRLGDTINDSGALHNASPAELIVNNCILWANTTAGQGGETAQIWNDGGALEVNNSCVEGWTGAYPGVGSSGRDPQMVNDSDNLRLTAGSPCINHGDNAWLPSDDHDLDEDGNTGETIPLDLDMYARIANGTVDAGAYEFQGPACIADIDGGGDGEVNIDDLLAVINAWGQPGGPEDVNGDGTVDIDDLLIVINAWGPCP